MSVPSPGVRGIATPIRLSRSPAPPAGPEIGCSPGQLEIAWLIRRSPRVVPLVDARTPEQLADTLEAADMSVPGETMDRIDKASALDLGFPHDFLRKNRAGWYADADAALDPRLALLRERITDPAWAWTTIDRSNPATDEAEP